MATSAPAPLWTPSPQRVAAARMTAFLEEVAREEPAVDDYASLWRWSVDAPERFWAKVWDWCGVVPARPVEAGGAGDGGGVLRRAGGLCGDDVRDVDMRDARWFPGARLNFAENLLRYRDDRPALVAWNEEGRQRAWTYRELAATVARLQRFLRAAGVGEGDRVAGFLPNLPEAVAAMLATASLGAIWSSCSPDFGVKGVLDRFGQIRPKVLFTADAHLYGGKRHPSLPRVREIVGAIPAIERVVVVPYLDPAPDTSGLRDVVLWDEALAATPGEGVPGDDAPRFVHLPFDHPLYVMYSSGTTGLPKCMVHGAGGTLLQHLKELALHTDLGRDDRIFYFTTCGWMMWNWLVSSLAVGATVVVYDGAPMTPGPTVLLDLAEAEGITVFGTSAKYVALLEKEGVVPRESHDLAALRTVLSTGSPLLPEGFDYVYRDWKDDVCLSSISGGTDIISCFALGNPIAPVYRGELQTRGLGMRVEVFDEAGRPVEGEKGELVCTRPFPSMPVAFWDDPDGQKYHDAYFDVFPGVWRHGDWAELTPRGGVVIYGRSDATLNPSGVRIGTAEIYRQVEQEEAVVESLVVGQDFAGDTRIVLFVRLRDGVELDEALRQRIRRRIRDNASPHHVPKKIVAVPDIPRTLSGKITELAVRETIHGRPVKNRDALANPAALDHFRDLPELAEP